MYHAKSVLHDTSCQIQEELLFWWTKPFGLETRKNFLVNKCVTDPQGLYHLARLGLRIYQSWSSHTGISNSNCSTGMSWLLYWFQKWSTWALFHTINAGSRIIANVIQIFRNLVGWYSCGSRSLRLVCTNKKKSKYARIFSKVNSNIELLHILK